MKRKTVRNFALVVLILLAIAGVAVQILLWSDYPRKIALDQAQRLTGLRIDAQSLRIGWLGNVVLRDVSVRLPLDDAELVRIENIRAELPPLLWIALSRSADVRAVEVIHPVVNLRQDSSGRWNVEQLIDLLGARNASPAVVQTSSHPASVRLPDVKVNDATLNVVDRAGRTATVAHVELTGGPDGPVSWKGVLDGGEKFHAEVVTATAGDWPHEATFRLRDVETLSHLWTNGALEGLVIDGAWTGRKVTGGVTGIVDFKQATLRGFDVSGGVAVQGGIGKVTVSPRGLLLKTPEKLAPEIRATGGTVVIDTAGATASQLDCSLAGGQALVDGKYSFVDGSAGATAHFRDVSLPGALKQSGTFDASLRRDWPGSPVVRATLASTGAGSGVNWDGEFQVDGTGEDFKNMDWTLLAPRLRIEQAAAPQSAAPRPPATQAVAMATPAPTTAPVIDDEFAFPEPVSVERSLVLDQLRADVTTRGPVVTLRSLKLADTNTLAGRGQFDGEKNTWWLYAHARALPLRTGQTAEALLDVWGDSNEVRLKSAFFRAGQLNVWGDGVYTFDNPQPVDVEVNVSHPRLTLTDASEAGPLRGAVEGKVRVVGLLGPLNLIGTGELDGHDVSIGSRKVGDLSIAIEAGIDGHEAWLRSDKLQLFGGTWQARGAYPVAGGSFRIVTQTAAVPVQELALLAGVTDPVTGSLAGRWTLDLPGGDVDALLMDGRFVVTGASYSRTATTQPTDTTPIVSTRADRIEGRTTLRDGQLRIGTRGSPIRFTQAGGASAELRATVNLDDRTQVKVNLTGSDWPIDSPATASLVRASVKTELDVSLRGMPWVTGPASVKLDVSNHDRHLLTLDGDLDLSTVEASTTTGDRAAVVARRVVDVKRIGGDVLSGPVNGRAKIDLDQPLTSTADLAVTNLQASKLEALDPSLDGLRGTFAGTLNLAPAADPRAVEPLKLTLNLTPVSAAWRDVNLGAIDATAYLNTNRAVLDRSQLQLADGVVNVWGRISQPTGAGMAMQMQVEMKDLDLPQIDRSVRKPSAPAKGSARTASKPLTGKLSGNVTLAGDPRQKDRMFGQGSVTLIKADLLDYPVVSFLYRLMNIGLVFNAENSGRGDADFRLEGDRLELAASHYYDRGVEVRANGSVRDIWSTSASPLTGTAVGSPKPLGEIKLPLLGELGDVLGAVANGAVVIHIDGTLQNPSLRQVPFEAVGEGLRKLILGDVRHETRPNAAP